MKKSFTILIFIVLCSAFLKAQHVEKTPQTASKEEIAFLEDLISKTKDAKEKAKAEAMLSALKNKKVLSEAEEQQKMSETLSPAQYDAWKASKSNQLKPQITKPEDEK
jgi:hypothetical protein